jgi:hypothetical protein
MESVASEFGRAVIAHREAVAYVEAARARLRERDAQTDVSAQAVAGCRRWAARMQQLAVRRWSHLGGGVRPVSGTGRRRGVAAPGHRPTGFQAVLSEAEERIERAQVGERDPSVLLLAGAAFPPEAGRVEWSRMAAIAHAGPNAGVFALLAGYPPPQHPGLEAVPRLERTTHWPRW